MENLENPPKSFFTARMRPAAKKLVITFAAICAMVVLFLLPPYREWLQDRVIDYYKDFEAQTNKMAVEQRMAYRFGGAYTYSKQIAGFFDKKEKAAALVLVPPTDYFKKYGIDYHVPEPAVFYYFTGLKTVWPNSSNAANAGWYVHVVNGKIAADSITDRKAFADTLTTLNKFNISL